jgi:hypothetical protein
MQHLLAEKIITLLLFISVLPNLAKAQLRDGINLPDHDEKLFHFGINLGQYEQIAF